jgi:hypothetical protein
MVEVNMKKQVKPNGVLTFGAILMSGMLSQTVDAQTLLESGTSTLAPSLAPVGGEALNPQEYLTVTWQVYQNSSGPAYTYDYTVNNPAGDVLLNDDGTLTSTPEIVDFFALNFDTTVPGAFVSGNDSIDNGPVGLDWLIDAPVITAGNSSSLLTFDSDLPPTLGDADASDGNPPSPWSSAPNGSEVPIPNTVPDGPTTTTLLAPTALLLVSLRKRSAAFGLRP